MIVDNRTGILQQALDLFAAKGYDAVGVQEIAAAAGVTKPTLYHYFGSKAGLLDALLHTYLDDLIETVQVAACYRRDLPLTLAQVTAAYFEFARRYPTVYRLQLALQFAPPESEPGQQMRTFNEAQHMILETLFVHATADHGNMRGRHQRYAVTLRGMIDTYIGLYLNGYMRLDGELLHQAVHQFMHGIYS